MPPKRSSGESKQGLVITLVFFILVDVLGCVFLDYTPAQMTGAVVVGIIDAILLMTVFFRSEDRSY